MDRDGNNAGCSARATDLDHLADITGDNSIPVAFLILLDAFINLLRQVRSNLSIFLTVRP